MHTGYLSGSTKTGKHSLRTVVRSYDFPENTYLWLKLTGKSSDFTYEKRKNF